MPFDVAQLDGAVEDADDGIRLGDTGQSLGNVGQALGARHRGHRLGVVQPWRRLLERRGHDRQKRAVLQRRHPPGREGTAVRERLDNVVDIVGVGPRDQEGRVGRVQRWPGTCPVSYTLPDVDRRQG